eukprot:13841356-Heterocapsa_arctica.AAC.1
MMKIIGKWVHHAPTGERDTRVLSSKWINHAPSGELDTRFPLFQVLELACEKLRRDRSEKLRRD